MTPAERLALLKALKSGIEEAITQTEQEVHQVMQATGADRFATKIGSVGLTKGRTTIGFDEDRLLKFAEQYGVDAVETKVRPTFRSLFSIDDDAVIYNPTGEVVDFATVRQGRPSLTTRLTDAIKLEAASNVPALLRSLPGLESHVEQR